MPRESSVSFHHVDGRNPTEILKLRDIAYSLSHLGGPNIDSGTEPKPRKLQKQQEFLITEPSLQPLHSCPHVMLTYTTQRTNCGNHFFLPFHHLVSRDGIAKT